MNCRTYVFLLTSDQLGRAPWARRAGAAAHRLVCAHCRAFTRHDQHLLQLARLGAHGLPPDPPDRAPAP